MGIAESTAWAVLHQEEEVILRDRHHISHPIDQEMDTEEVHHQDEIIESEETETIIIERGDMMIGGRLLSRLALIRDDDLEMTEGHLDLVRGMTIGDAMVIHGQVTMVIHGQVTIVFLDAFLLADHRHQNENKGIKLDLYILTCPGDQVEVHMKLHRYRHHNHILQKFQWNRTMGTPTVSKTQIQRMEVVSSCLPAGKIFGVRRDCLLFIAHIQTSL